MADDPAGASGQGGNPADRCVHAREWAETSSDGERSAHRQAVQDIGVAKKRTPREFREVVAGQRSLSFSYVKASADDLPPALASV